MDFSFETIYDHAALTAMARAIRKLFRGKSNLVTRIFMVLVLAIGIYVSTPLSGNEFRFTVSSLICYASLILIFVTLVWEDAVNALFSRKRLPRGVCTVNAEFDDEGFLIKIGESSSRCAYQRVKHLAETKYFYIFVFNENRAEIFDKDGLSGITEEEFRDFICKKTQKQFQRV